jgi:uncharacterized protein YecE (DUF72 family)
MIGKTAEPGDARRLYVGTSGWSYEHWRGRFYPAELDEREWLEFYASRFPTVELNVTFYRAPFPNMIESWRRRTPQGFLFAAKGSRIVTHCKRLRRASRDVERFLKRVGGLANRLGAVLWQLPPSLPKDDKLLARFLRRLPKAVKHAVEFRHPSWYGDEVYDILRAHDTAMVGVSSRRMPPNFEITGSFIYLRFHGLAGGFAHDYTCAELEPWAEHAAYSLRKGLRVFAYFNNDAEARALANAKMFESMVVERIGVTERRR